MNSWLALYTYSVIIYTYFECTISMAVLLLTVSGIRSSIEVMSIQVALNVSIDPNLQLRTSAALLLLGHIPELSSQNLSRGTLRNSFEIYHATS